MHSALLLTVLVASGLIRASEAAPVGPPSTITAVTRPCSLRKVAAELTRRCGTRVSIHRGLLDTRVVWAFAQPRSLEGTLGRLADLTDSRLLKNEVDGKPYYTLSRKPATAEREVVWRVAAIRRTLDTLLRAADEYDQGKLDPAAYSRGLRVYLKRTGGDLHYLRRFTPEQLSSLLTGGALRIPAEQLTDDELHRTVDAAFPLRDPEDPADVVERRRDSMFQSARRAGVTLHLEEASLGGYYVLRLSLGRAAEIALCTLSDEEVGLPLTHRNPYRWLEESEKAAASPSDGGPPSAALQRELPEDVLAGPRFEEAVTAIARAAGIDVVSDAYLARAHSRLPLSGPAPRIVAAKGVTAAAALDAICRTHQYVWWEQNGCVYLRARAWPWDQEQEPPDTVLDSWTTALARGRALGPNELLLLRRVSSRQLTGLAGLGERPFVAAVPDVYRPSLSEFLTLFDAARPDIRQQFLGRGVSLQPDQAKSMLISPFHSRTKSGPALLRLSQKVTRHERTRPPEWRLELALVRQWPEETSEMAFAFDIPDLAPPYLPP